jgi:phosphotransferase system enzyme I (PtsP)
LLRQAHQEVCAQHGDCRFPMVGAMLEVPSSVYQMTAMARHVDFFSIGSNDLIQYFLAVDRNNAQVASLYDGLHPAVLQLFQQAAVQAQALGKPIGGCGELASDPAAVLLLLAMGFNQLSVSSIPLPRVKWVVRSVTMARAREVLQEVLMLEDAEEVRAHVEPILEEFGLGGLIRAGH